MTDEEFSEKVMMMARRRVEFDVRKLPLFDKPVVYMALGKDDVLYVGMSSCGLGRVFGKGHHVLSRIHTEIVKLHVYETESIKDASKLESMMIQEFRPLYNGRKYIKSVWRKDGRGSRAAEVINALR